MEALGVTQINYKLYWHGRKMTKEVIREFIALDNVKKAYPFLIRAKELGLREYGHDYDFDFGEFCVTVSFRDECDLARISYEMWRDGTECFIVFNGNRYVGEDYYIENISFVLPWLNCSAELAANKRRMDELERANAEMAAQIIELKADIAERKLRPGGEEDYEAARERFTMGAYE